MVARARCTRPASRIGVAASMSVDLYIFWAPCHATNANKVLDTRLLLRALTKSPDEMTVSRRQASLWLYSQSHRFCPGRTINITRRSLAHQTSPPLSSPPSPVDHPATPSEYNAPVSIPENSPSRTPKLQDGRGGGFYLSLLAGAIVTTPIISYFYYEHRKAHMKAKKEAILHDIQARVKARG